MLNCIIFLILYISGLYVGILNTVLQNLFIYLFICLFFFKVNNDQRIGYSILLTINKRKVKNKTQIQQPNNV